MRVSLLTLCFVSLLIGGLRSAAGATADEQKFFNEHLGELVKIEPTRLRSAAVEQVFSVPMYLVKIRIGDGTQTLDAARVDSRLVDVSLPDTNADMPALKKLISPKFTMSDLKSAKILEASLDALYPIDTSSSEDMKAKAIKRDGTTWSFIRGKFFEHFKGFVVTTDSAGKVSGIRYSLEIP